VSSSASSLVGPSETRTTGNESSCSVLVFHCLRLSPSSRSSPLVTVRHLPVLVLPGLTLSPALSCSNRCAESLLQRRDCDRLQHCRAHDGLLCDEETGDGPRASGPFAYSTLLLTLFLLVIASSRKRRSVSRAPIVNAS
jgi:hypothetical protein